MRGLPGDDAQRDDDQARDQPHHHFDRGRVRPVRLIARLGIGRAVLPGEHQREHDHRHHHQQHEPGGDQDDVLDIDADLPFRVEQRHVAAGQQEQAEAGQEPRPTRQYGFLHVTTGLVTPRFGQERG
ncbi:hypothetical protein D3C81_1370760 [compost metagenome]